MGDRYGHVFREHAAFLAKAPSHIRCNDAHPTLWPVQELGHIPSDAMRRLGRVPHCQEVLLGLIGGRYPARLQRHGGQALHMVALLDDPIGLGKGRGQITSLVRHPQPYVAPQRRVDGGDILLHAAIGSRTGGKGS